MKRIGMMIGIKADKIEKYKKLHDKVWPEVLENLTELNCKNYSIYLLNNMLFGYNAISDNYLKDDGDGLWYHSGTTILRNGKQS